MVETTQEALCMQMALGILPKWWSSKYKPIDNCVLHGKERHNNPILLSHAWEYTLKWAGFNGLDVNAHDGEDREMYATSVLMSTAVAPAPLTFHSEITLLHEQRSPPAVRSYRLKTSLAAFTSSMPREVSLERVDNLDDRICIFLADVDEMVRLDLNTAKFNAFKTLINGAREIL